MSESRDTDIAVIGMACRFPGADDLETFWDNIRNGVESIAFFSEQEAIEAGIAPELLADPNYVRAGGVLSDVEQFDASFFGFSPREAAVLDPQQRLMMECAWKALEHAGYAALTYTGYISVHAGAGASSYLVEHLAPNRDELAGISDPFQVQLGNDKDHIATRVSYKLNLKGPSIGVQTACSTSLVAIHLACQSLLNGESDLALAGGVAVQLPQKAGYLYHEGMILSPDGHCRAFDRRARGTVGGSGVGMVALKRLTHALADGDTIYAVVRGSAINNDGAVKVGYTAPSASGQKEVIVEAMALADVDPATITLVEAHGTGTELGDPIEVAALTQAFRTGTSRKGYCALGSVKTNVGHLDTAAGVCGFIKAVLALHHRTLPPSLHFEHPNPNIDFANSPFYVRTAAAEWITDGHPRRAGVSSFGIGGTNAHIVLEEAPPQAISGSARPWQLLLLSAKTQTALETMTRNIVGHLQGHPDANLADLAYTLQVGRCAMPYRRALVAHSHQDVTARWGEGEQPPSFSHVHDTGVPSIVFMFPGQGAQYVSMARELYDDEPNFRQQLDRCAEVLKPHLGLDVRDVIYPDAPRMEDGGWRMEDREASILHPPSSILDQTQYTQPALFALEYALAQLWISWGVKPQAMIGHSIGEYVAACLAGVFSLEDALAIVAARGRLIQGLPPGAMLSVPLSQEALRPLLLPALALAAVNGPEQCVVAGPGAAIDALAGQLERRGVTPRRLRTSHAFHSPMMRPILEPFAGQLARIELKPPQIPYLSNVTGTWITAAQATDPEYWATHLHQPVRLGDGLEQVLQAPNQILLEVGPGRTLGTLAAHHPRKREAQLILASLRHVQDRQPDSALILNTLGRLWLAGVPVDWAQFAAHETRRHLPLPTYPFEHQRYWIEAKRHAAQQQPDTRTAAVAKRASIAEWFYTPSWKRTALPKPRQSVPAGWLLFVDQYGLGSSIAEHLRRLGQDVIVVRIGERFARLDRESYTIHPLRSDDYVRLIEALAAPEPPRNIVHLWNIAPVAEAGSAAAEQDFSFYSLLFLAQAIGSHLLMEPIELTCVVNGLSDVTGDEITSPEKALLLGPCKVFAQEYPHKRSRCIDLVWPHAGVATQVSGQLLAELLAPADDAMVAYRGQRRWVQIYEPVALTGPDQQGARLKRHGVYLITGGLGGMGLAFARHLAQTVQARLVLVSRSALPPREAWGDWLATHGDQDDTSRKIIQLQQIADLGAELEITAADVSDSAGMRALLKQVRERFGQVDGIIHAAGVPGEGIMLRKTRQAAAQVLSAKVAGTAILEQVVREAPPDFLVLCSSLRSITGGAGHVDYCAANAFLDAYAIAKSRQAAPATSVIAINWDGWQEVGMSAAAAERLGHGSESLNDSLTTEEGLQVLDWVLNNSEPQVIVSAIPLQTQIERANDAAELGALAQPQTRGRKQGEHPRPNLATPYAAPTNENERLLAAIWRELFGIEQVGIHDNFFELGGDSIIAVRAVARATDMELRLTVGQVFEHQTIAGLSQVAGSARAVEAEQEVISGSAPLTPIQRWFFDQQQPEPDHFNQALLLAVPHTLAADHLEAALQQIVLHHDALRSCFVRGPEGWRHMYAPPSSAVPFTVVDLSAVALEHQPAALEAEATALQAGLDLTQGPVMRAALFSLGHNQDQRLLIVIHHLVVDAFSWRILHADLQTALRQRRAGEPIRLPPKTTSFKRWAERLVEYAQGERAREELGYWLSHTRHPAVPLPRDAVGANLVASMQQVSVSLHEAETQALLRDIPRTRHLQIQDLLVAVLARTIATWTADPTVVIDIEAQGRDLPLDGVDVSRTVGWFTALCPLWLTLDSRQDLDGFVRSVKEQIQALPNNRLSYGPLRYGCDDRPLVERLEALPQAEIMFLHLGRIDADLSGDGMLAIAEEPVGPNQSPRGKRPYLIEVSSMITGGCLRIEWAYSQNIHARSTIERLAHGMLETLCSLIARAQSPGSGSYAPSDFPLADLDQRKLEKLAALLDKGKQRKGIV